jgi:hypothetical protein
MMDAWVDRIFGALSQAFDRDSAFTPILTAAQELDFEHCAYGMRLALPVSNPKTFMVNNYPEPWQRRYSDSGYLDIDPTAIHGRRSQTAIVWSDAVFQDAGQMWSEARSFDLKVGIAQSTFGGNGSVSMLTLSRLLKYSPACGLNPPALARLFRQFPHLEIQHSIRPVFCLSRPISRLFFPHTRPCRRICPRLRSRVRL